jgi:xanthine phosphoribosyltransferase
LYRLKPKKTTQFSADKGKYRYNQNMKYYGYEAFQEDILRLKEDVRGFAPDTIVAIARGGVVVAQALAYALDIRDVQSVQAQLYDETAKREGVQVMLNCDLQKSKRVLVADDIADSGETLQAVMALLRERYCETEFKSVTLFYKKTAVMQPDYTLKEATEWIDFFWERDFV